uniref:FBD domain-containing protein n=1 Tax=Panagrolaimus sp. ES5 TaxID=591445 RepID=A0AC34F128_9BILA
MVHIDEVLEKLPNVFKFMFNSDQEMFSPETLQRLVEVKLWNKLKIFQLQFIHLYDNFDAALLCDFIIKNGASFSQFIFIFDDKLKAAMGTLNAATNKTLEAWKGDKPFIKVL